MTNDVLRPQLWTPRPVKETIELYTDWAKNYDADVKDRGYVTPARVADALSKFLAPGIPVLDYGCGTGLSGLALKTAGLGPLHGTDIAQAMLDEATKTPIYERVWLSKPGDPPAAPGDYAAIVATGVVSLGGAPPECFDLLLDALAPDGLFALSFNDPTLEDGSYEARLDARSEELEVLFREHGPHLTSTGMGADVLVLRRT